MEGQQKSTDDFPSTTSENKNSISNNLQQEFDKQKTIIIPTGSLGDISKTRIRILEKTLESKLDNYFVIVPKELFNEAKEKVFEELDYDECTEEQCIIKIQELLQIENAFKMELVSEGQDTQISITWNDQDEKRIVEDYCEDCKTKELREMIVGLVENLVRGKTKLTVDQPHLVLEKKAGVKSGIINNFIEDDSNYVLRTKNKKINVSRGKWEYLKSGYSYSKSYQSKTKFEGHMYKQIITVFLIPMTDDRKKEEIAKNEYFESFVLRANSITVQIRIDKGDYWVMSRETYNTFENFPVQKDFSYSNALINFRGIQDRIDRTRFILNKEF